MAPLLMRVMLVALILLAAHMPDAVLARKGKRSKRGANQRHAGGAQQGGQQQDLEEWKAAAEAEEEPAADDAPTKRGRRTPSTISPAELKAKPTGPVVRPLAEVPKSDPAQRAPEEKKQAKTAFEGRSGRHRRAEGKSAGESTSGRNKRALDDTSGRNKRAKDGSSGWNKRAKDGTSGRNKRAKEATSGRNAPAPATRTLAPSLRALDECDQLLRRPRGVQQTRRVQAAVQVLEGAQAFARVAASAEGRPRERAGGVEAVEGGLEPVPLGLDHLPVEPGLEQASGHHRQPAVVRYRGQVLGRQGH